MGMLYMKIALLLTGLLRTYRDTYQSLLKIFPCDKVDIFMDIWDIEDTIDPYPMVDRKNIKKIYRPKDFHMEKWSAWRNQHMGQLKKAKTKGKTPPKNAQTKCRVEVKKYISAYIQFYKLSQGFARIPTDYDIIMRTRCDIRFDETAETCLLDEVINNSDKIVCFDYEKRDIVCNRFIASSRKNMSAYINFFNYVPYLFDNFGYTIEEALFQYLTNYYSIKLHRVPHNYTFFRRPPQACKVFHSNLTKRTRAFLECANAK